MSNKSNHLNTIHTTRPAVALFRKPLATNDEMNNELRKLLGEFVEIQSETKTKTRIKKTVNGNIKAVFYNPYYHYLIPIRYGENLMFSRIERGSVGRSLEGFISQTAGITAAVLLKSDFMMQFPDYVKGYIKNKRNSRVRLNEYREVNIAEETLKWYVIVYDKDYVVPELKKDEPGLAETGGVRYYTLNKDIIKSSKKLNIPTNKDSWFISQYLTEVNRINENINFEQKIPISPVALYTLSLVDKNIYLSIQSYESFESSSSNYFSYTSVQTYQENQIQIDNLIDRYEAKKVVIDHYDAHQVLEKQIKVKSLSAILGFNSNAKNSNLFSYIRGNSKAKPTLEYGGYYYDYNTEEICTTSAIKEGSSLNNFYIAYIGLANQLNYELYKDLHKYDKYDREEYDALLSKGLYEFPLRYKDITSGYTKEGISKKTIVINSIRQFESALSSFSSKDIKTVTFTKTPYTITNEYRTVEAIQAAVPNPKLIDFKLLYYLFIEYNVVVPKYKKLEDDFIEATNQNSLNGISFSKQSLVKMVPSDFFSITQNVADQTNINNVSSELYDKTNNYTPKQIISKWYETITKWDNETKETLCRRYEDIYYGNWSGFYYSNATLNEESIAGYTNTKVPFSYTSGTKISYSPYIMSDSSTSYVENSLNALNVNDISNRDVTSITVSREMTGESSATVIINAISEKYTYKTGLNKGKSLFDPYDEVILFLPNLDGTISQSFKGYITSIQQVNNQGYHNIALQCSCPLTLLQRVRTNIKPSFDLLEASGSYPTPFSVREDLYKSIENWIPFMCIQGLSYFTSMLHPFTQSDLTDDLYTIAVDQKNTQITMPSFNDLLLNYLWFRDSNNASDQNNASYFLNELIQEYTSTVSYLNLKGSETLLYTKGIQSVASVYAHNNAVNKEEYKKVEYEVYAQRDGFNEPLTTKNSNLIERTLVAKITGTLQPTFALGTSDIPLVFSNYKPNMEILKETAEKFNFAFYSRRDGVVMFEPINTSLFNLNLALQNTDKNYTMYKDYSKITDFAYNIPDILNYQTVVRFEDKEEVDKIVNWLQIAGSYREDESLSGEGVGSATTIVDVPSIKKYGTHAQNQQAILGITNMDALKVYASALMDRQNRYFRTASCTTLGNGNAEVNCPVYSAINNTMYVRTGLVLNYKAGDSFTSDHVLHWGKKPLYDFTTKENKDRLNNALEKSNIMQSSSDTDIHEAYYTPINNIILEVVSTLNQNNEINPAYYRQLAFILNNKGSQYLLPLFVFNGYLWEGLASISFEDLSTYNPTDAILSGFQTSLFTKLATKSSDKETYKDTVSMKDVGFKEATKELADISQNLRNVAVGIYNSANKQDIRSIYVGTGKFSIK